MNSMAGDSSFRIDGVVGVRGPENVDDVAECGGVRYDPLLDEPLVAALRWRGAGRLGSGGAPFPSSLTRFGLEGGAGPEEPGPS
jgi:hypothetical protein